MSATMNNEEELRYFLQNRDEVIGNIVYHTKYNKYAWSGFDKGKYIARILYNNPTMDDATFQEVIGNPDGCQCFGLRQELCEADDRTKGMQILERVLRLNPHGRDLIHEGYYTYWWHIPSYGGDILPDNEIVQWKDQAFKFIASVLREGERQTHECTNETIKVVCELLANYGLFPRRKDIDVMKRNPSIALQKVFDSINSPVCDYAIGILCGMYLMMYPQYAENGHVEAIVGKLTYAQLKGFFRVLEHISSENFLDSKNYPYIAKIHDDWSQEVNEKHDEYSEDYGDYYD